MLIKSNEKRKEEAYMLNFMACYNAFGLINGGKKFKAKHPFENKENKKSIPTQQARNETLDFIKGRIERESG